MHPSHEPNGRLTALGNQLIEIHLWLREELARLRTSLDSPGADLRSSEDLRAHCLGFCAALTRHHGGEDGGAFRVLAEREPALRPVLAELAEDHRMVAGILRRIEDLTTGPAAARAAVRAELDGLAALLESHFTYEEKKLVAALDAVNRRAGDTVELLGVPLPDDGMSTTIPRGTETR
ncbi:MULTISPECIES: hemerythrin domain-containing protein [Micromonospora]|uniref:hemerythrin domain-containing protein n=1 Tax=Micromonospora TaxID=1873 RepID=UPI00191C4810|nr:MULTISPECIES: hemerythrin domain-containing protein [unclassified Micromonospora]MBM0226887.1 hemerythrin domain-containing protein [Micromonospora sp. ATA51]